MADFSVQVWDNDGATVLPPADVTLRPTVWSARAIGGPVAAEIDVMGSVAGLLTLGNWLGYRIQIVSDVGQVLWWGHVDSVTVITGDLEREIALDGMANRVKVLYAERLPGGTLAGTETDWTEDAASVAVYGRREMVHSASSALTAAQALALRGRVLDAGRLPQKRLFVGQSETVAGRVRCRGDWQRLDDCYYAQAAGIEGHTTGGEQAIPLGLGLVSAYIGFGGMDSARRIHQAYGRFADWNYTGLKLVVAGTSSNNGVRTLASIDRKSPVSYTANTISFDPSDDIDDSAYGMTPFAVGDMIWISGASQAANNGAKLVKTAGRRAIEISPGWSGGEIVAGAAGPNVTILRGNSLIVEESVTVERPNGTTNETITAYGQRIYQSFALASGPAWTLARVEMRLRRVGAPADGVQVSLVLDSAGTPGSVIEQVTVASGDIADVMDWIGLVFANTATLSYGTTYGLLVERTGAMDSMNFYEVAIDPAGGYGRGAMRLHDGTSYQADGGDLIFRCLGAQDTATQIRDVVMGVGLELNAVQVETASGILTVQHQPGDETALAIVKALLSQGMATGERLLATTTAGRLVRVFQRMIKANARRWFVWRNGRIEFAQGEAPPPGWLPAGEWVFVDDVLLSGAWSELSPVFVEAAEYAVGQGLRLETEDQRAVAQMFGVRQG